MNNPLTDRLVVLREELEHLERCQTGLTQRLDEKKKEIAVYETALKSSGVVTKPVNRSKHVANG